MKKNNLIVLVVTVLVCLAPMILGATLYNDLPEQMPVHFTVNDVPDNYANKNFALFGLPLIMAIVQFLCCFFTMRRVKEEKTPKLFKIMYVFIPIIEILVYLLMIGYSLGIDVYIGKSVCLILGIIFILIGNYTPKMSYEAGKKYFHPAPKDEKSFRKMNKVMGYSFMILGIIFLILVFFV